MKKLAAIAIGGILLVAVPALASPVKDGFLSIRGPERLTPRGTLRVPIRCSVACVVKVRPKLKLPGDDIPPGIAGDRLRPGKTRNVIVNLNQNALDEIQAMPEGSRLRVSARAKSRGSGKRVHVVKVFEFSAPAP